MADIFQEVDDDLKKDKATAWWKRYGRYVIAVAVLLVAGTAGYQAWTAYDLNQRSERSDAYAEALALAAEPSSEAEALSNLSEIASNGDTYGMLASFEEARLLADADRTDEAVAIWDRIAAEQGNDQAFGSVATLLAVMHQVDDGDVASLKARLEPLAVTGSAFRPTATELLATLALRENDKQTARDLFTELADDLTAPAGIRARATQMIEALKD
ncbi:tetratricopeptide repeat protein [Denitrobaculum tricleocarpae]|uniref:Tetratricopeptide repeat protein n=1 Tax=Denitrobaculum tricleocarpae TaxID=2591009 RepID=A0A545TU07_9PROT|nr:tetratricopeptide repeat protein [Denitrobaculum tricleocarpae]TQV80699.1 tetratricopeptide repeat protein [Denitrobaculum tricleocarpae]